MSTAHPTHPLDNPVRAALTGPHAHFARRQGRLLSYPADMTAFLGMPDRPRADDWADVAALLGPGGHAVTLGVSVPPPADWEATFEVEGVQLVGERVVGAHDPHAVRLGPADVPEILALVEQARPGPFFARTIELGDYLGIREGGALIAMAGERLHPPGFTEISAVCTDHAHRGQGLAGRLIRAVAAGIQDRGETPFLHAAADNTGAIGLYQALGFRLRRTVTFRGALVPQP
ncbi:ribosomal protein S18 acetylase RimI-like enzyme [Kitasatospora sp. MAP12-15]|uniref:GNAT family N-acetyltransferase n=1 Tax=unclassified Kitasatospora TaxID=2633591 RepID=UPI002473CB46|nr:GNAT family N-acetyltransferase [Kitasatospora sp. MAP12-44]MDH6108680.1 ribosomal protein S18 acetylase RimI-like enzyme [Kitasatospora sp. MAP12-44]